MAKDATVAVDTISVGDGGSNICSICSVEAVSRCQRCLSIVYCSKVCQQRGWTGQNSHRKICGQIKKAKEKVTEEEKKLKEYKRLNKKKNKKAKDCNYELINLFDTAVGKFWEIKEARVYCECRLELALALRECGAQNKSLLAVEIALEHLLALMRLAGGDHTNVIRNILPSLLLFLGKENQAYNFIKWWINYENNENVADWSAIDFLSLNPEDITEDAEWEDLDLCTQQLVDIALAKIKAKVRLEKEIGFGVTLKHMDEQLQDLFSILKGSNEILWKFVCDLGGMELRLNEEMEENPMMFIDPKGDMKVALDVKRNSSYIWRYDSDIQEFVKRNIGSKESLLEASQNAGWSKQLGSKKYSWLADCYRLRLDDDYVWGGCNLHGLYEDSSPMHIANDFIVFCVLAAKNGVIPILWDWSFFFEEASKKLNFAYEKSDAKDDWGMLGPMMLRMTADIVYEGGPSDVDHELQESIHDELENGGGEFFDDIGGENNWVRLVELVQHHSGYFPSPFSS